MNRLHVTGLAAVIFLTAGCSIPNLETPECLESRTPVREFYSFHFGNDRAVTAENLAARDKFLSRDLAADVQNARKDVDPFTLTDMADEPKAFRVGECRTVEAGKRAEFDILLFWKTDERSEQRKFTADAVKEGDAWRIADIK